MGFGPRLRDREEVWRLPCVSLDLPACCHHCRCPNPTVCEISSWIHAQGKFCFTINELHRKLYYTCAMNVHVCLSSTDNMSPCPILYKLMTML